MSSYLINDVEGRRVGASYARCVLRLIAAVDKSLGVADDHGIPWQGKIPTDARYFRERTTEGLIIMGYATYQEFDKPVHDRENYVVVRTDTDALQPGFAGVPDVANFLDEREDELVWVIGGAALFASTLARADELYLTQVDRDFQCTKFFPDFSDTFVRTWHDAPIVENGIAFHFTIWQRTNNRQN